MRVAITGGAGFIGANLARLLATDEQVSRVMVVDDLSTGRRENLVGVAVDLHVGTILNPTVLDAAFAEADAIVHLAARPSVSRSLEYPVASHHASATGTLEVLEAARRVGRPQVIVASSSVNGANPTLPKSEDLRTQPLSPYTVSKLAPGSYVLVFSHCFDLPVLAFRFFNCSGRCSRRGTPTRRRCRRSSLRRCLAMRCRATVTGSSPGTSLTPDRPPSRSARRWSGG
jgi:UDP-glucose 4-epimerase